MRSAFMLVACLVLSVLGVYVVGDSHRTRQPGEAEEPEVPGLKLTIHTITPNLKTLSVLGYRFPVRSSEAAALNGVKQLSKEGTANSMLITISNTTDRTFLIERVSLDWLVTKGTRFVDDDGNEWQIRFTPIHFSETSPAYSIPSIAGKSNQMVLMIGLTSFSSKKEGLVVPARLHYEVLQPASFKALEVIGDEAKPMVNPPAIVGKGVCPVDEEGLR